MPLRSVEAASRDDAIAAAREQFGPHARVVGVRRVRSGGVLGFFATERYIAEVAPDQFTRPGAPSPSTGRVLATPVAAYDSPLAAAAPARARTTAPARNGAAAWAAEAARPGSAEPVARRVQPRSAATDAGAPPSWPAASAARPARDDDRIDELAGLLGGGPSDAALSPGHGRSTAARATFPRASREPAHAARPHPTTPVAAPEPDGDAAPSPFTAALARMVSGDRDVRQAVDHALAQPAEPLPAAPVGSPLPTAPAARPSLAAAIRSAHPSKRSQAVQQEETTVKNQAAAPPTTTTTGAEELPTWAAAPQETAAPAPSARQEEIAEALRDALARGHSDEALAGILRKMLAGDSPREALAEPVLPVAVHPEPVAVPDEPAVVVEAPVSVLAEPAPPAAAPDQPTALLGGPAAMFDDAAAPATVLGEPAVLATVLDEPAAAASMFGEPVRDEPRPGADPLFAPGAPAPRTAEPVAGSSFPLFGTPAAPAAPADLGWGGTTLWGEPAPAPPAVDPALSWADVLLAAPAPEAHTPAEEGPTVAAVTAAAPADRQPADEVAAVEVAEPSAAVEAVSTAPLAEAAVAEEAVAEGAVVQETVAEEAVVEDDVVEESVVEDVVVEEAVVQETVAEEAVAEEAVVEEAVAAPVADVAEAGPLLARTASDPAPLTMSLDATTVMPRISLLPSPAGARGRGLPPVPPSSGRPPVPPSRPAPSAPRDEVAPAPAEERAPASPAGPAAPAVRTLATVTRLPVAPLMAGDDHPDMPELEDGTDVPTAPAPAPRTATAPAGAREVLARLGELGVPRELLGDDVVDRIEAEGTYAALTRALTERLPEAPHLPTGAGEVLFVVGPGVETLRAARALAASLRLDPDRVQWATRGDLAGLAPKGSRMTTIDAAIDRRQEAADAGTLTIVAVDAPLRSDAYWMSQMLAIWSPDAVWAVVEATRKPEDLEVWLDGLARVDALAVQDTDLSADPAAVLQRLTVPVALLDGVRATPHRWASLLCERLDSPQA